MRPQRLSALVVALLVSLNGSVHAQTAGLPPPAMENVSAPPPAPDGPPAPAEAGTGSFSGWFAGVDAFLFRPQSYIASDYKVSKELTPHLSWTVAPEVTVGYQFVTGDAFLASYRYLGSSAQSRTDYSTYRTPLNTHWLDLDYRGCLYQPCPTFTYQLQVGCRLGILERDNEFQSGYESGSFDSTFFGAGPHLGMNLAWRVREGGLGLFARADIGLLYGECRSEFKTHYTPQPGLLYPDYVPQDYRSTAHQSQWVINPRLELGMSWIPTTLQSLCVEGGVRLDDYDQCDESFKAGLILHNLGPFCRCTIKY